MPDVPARRRHFLEDPDLEPTLKVPAGETSPAAVKRRRYGDPRPRLDPNRRRIRCENPAWSCWHEAHETREDDAGVVQLCPSCAEVWDAEVDEERHLAALEARAEAVRQGDQPKDQRTCRFPTPDDPNYPACVKSRDRCKDPEHITWREGEVRREQAAFRTARGIPDRPRETLPSRQDRREEYDKRNAQRRRERREARAQGR